MVPKWLEAEINNQQLRVQRCLKKLDRAVKSGRAERQVKLLLELNEHKQRLAMLGEAAEGYAETTLGPAKSVRL